MVCPTPSLPKCSLSIYLLDGRMTITVDNTSRYSQSFTRSVVSTFAPTLEHRRSISQRRNDPDAMYLVADTFTAFLERSIQILRDEDLLE